MFAPRIRYGTLFRLAAFRYYFLSASAGDAAYAVYTVTILWVALHATGSVAVTGAVVALEFGIYSLSFVVGPFLDRIRDLRAVLLVGYPVQAVLAAVLGILADSDRLTVTNLLPLVAALSFAWDFTYTATLAGLPRLVPDERLLLANGLMSAVSSFDLIAGYVAGGVLVVVNEPGIGLFLYAALNLLGGLAALPLALPPVPGSRRSTSSSLFADLRSGWAYVGRSRDPPFLALAVYSAANAFFSGAPYLLILVLSRLSFGPSGEVYALLFIAFALGGIVGSLVFARLSPRTNLLRAILLAGAAEGAAVLYAFLGGPPFAALLGAWVLVGLFDPTFYNVEIAFVQARSPPELLARTISNLYVFRGSSRAAGALVIGFVAASYSSPFVGALVGLGFIGTTLGGPGLLRSVRRLPLLKPTEASTPPRSPSQLS
jgi:MFS family permease